MILLFINKRSLFMVMKMEPESCSKYCMGSDIAYKHFETDFCSHFLSKDRHKSGIFHYYKVNAIVFLKNLKLSYKKSVFAPLPVLNSSGSKEKNIGGKGRVTKVLVLFSLFFFIPMAKAIPVTKFPSLFLPYLPAAITAAVAYFLITALIIYVDRVAASVRVFSNFKAAGELLITAVYISFKSTIENIITIPFPNVFNGTSAIFPSDKDSEINSSEINRRINILPGYGGEIITLVVLSIITFLSSVWVIFQRNYYPKQGTAITDSPLPLAHNILRFAAP